MPLNSYRPEQKLYFLHIPKTAGTSYRILLEDHFDADQICQAYDFYSAIRLPEETLANYRMFRGHMGYNLINFLPDRPFVVTMIRNPVERAISHFNYIRKDPNHPMYGVIREKRLDLLGFLKDRKLSSELENFHIKALSQNIPGAKLRDLAHTTTTPLEFQQGFQRLRRGQSPEQMLDLALQRLEDLDFVGVVDRFDEGCLLTAHLLGTRPQPQPPRINVNVKRRSAIDDEAREILELRNALDLDFYHHAQARFAADFGIIMNQLATTDYYARYPAVNEPRDHIEFDFTQRLSGSGWMQREHQEELGFFRWTGPGVESELDLPLQSGRNYELSVQIVGAMADDILESLELFLDDQALSYTREDHDREYEVRAYLPEGAVSTHQFPHKLRLQVSRTINTPTHDPKQALDHNESRLCGLAVKGVKIVPLSPAAKPSVLKRLTHWIQR